MRIKRNINTKLTVEEARAQAASHLAAKRYRQTSDGVEMVFQRGSVLGSIFSFSAHGSMAQVYLRPRPVENGTAVGVIFVVTTSGRIVTGGEKNVWEDEFRQLENAFNPAPEILSTDTPHQAEVIPDAPLTEEEYSIAPPPLSAAVQAHVSLIFAVMLALFCLIVGWLVKHSILSAIVGLLIGVGAGFVLSGVWMSRFEDDAEIENKEEAGVLPATDTGNTEEAKPQ